MSERRNNYRKTNHNRDVRKSGEWTPDRRNRITKPIKYSSKKKYFVMCGAKWNVFMLKETDSFMSALWFTVLAILSKNYSRVHFERNMRAD